jgi:hypothetical protein
MAVVDSQLRVIGVADCAWWMPPSCLSLPPATNSPTMMIAEKAAEMMTPSRAEFGK